MPRQVDVSPEAVQAGLQVLDDLLGQLVRLGQVVEVGEALSLSQKRSRLVLSRAISSS
jgi:hypothetical protein